MTAALLPSKVLFVDDDRSTRVAFANAARALGVEATVADSGGQALELAQQSHFTVVVTDMNMPGIDAMGLIERLSSIDPALAFVLVSGNPELQAGISKRIGASIAAFLGKPLDVHELQGTLSRAFALHQRRKARAQRSPPPTRSSLLIVEDSPGDANLLEEYLSGVPGLDVVQACSTQ